MVKLNGWIFWLKMRICWKNMVTFVIKSIIVYKKELDWEPIYNKDFLKTKTKSHGD